MSTKHTLVFLFFCGFAQLTVSVKTCEKELKVGDTCSINLPSSTDVSKMEIKWTFNSSGSTVMARQKFGANKEKIAGAVIEPNGALTLQNVQLDKTGKYKYQIYNENGERTAEKEMHIIVYAKVQKPNVEFKCHNGNATLTCKTKMTDKNSLTVKWVKGTESIQGADKLTLIQTSAQLQENKPYSCTLHNPVSHEKSDSKAVWCPGPGPSTIFGIDFWLMVSILAGGGALLLLLLCVLVICACRKCKQREREREEEELRLNHFPASHPPVYQKAKTTAKGQPAPPIPQDSPCCGPTTQTPPRTQAQPKAQVRARPPPPPPDEEEPPSLPQPRKTHHRERRHQEPYRPME